MLFLFSLLTLENVKMKATKLSLALAVLLATSAVSAAGFAGATSPSSDETGVRHIEVGISPKDGKAAVSVVDTNLHDKWYKEYANNKLTSFAKMKSMADKTYVPDGFISPDNNGVVVARLYLMTGFPWNMIPMPDHSHLGRMSFAQVGNQDVWFGDWADVPSGASAGTVGSKYTVFYSGTDKTTNLPTSGSATYAVKGINRHVNKNDPVLTGTLTANFGTQKLSGTIAKTGLSIQINDANINSTAASFNGNATANGTVKGNTQGHFFGAQGAGLAGIATFKSNRNYNTAFGGTKQ